MRDGRRCVTRPTQVGRRIRDVPRANEPPAREDGDVRFFDLRQMDEDSLLETDLCIVGSGPAGLPIAKEFAGTDIEVLVLESGGLESEAATQAMWEPAVASTGRI
jgi:hypothetical protein